MISLPNVGNRLFKDSKDISTACRQKGLLFPRTFLVILRISTRNQPEVSFRSCVFWTSTLVFFGRFGNVWANSLARDVRRIREKRFFRSFRDLEATPHRTCNRNTPCVPSALSPSSRSPSPARTLPSTPATAPSPRAVWSRLATPPLARYVSPRNHHCFVSVASRACRSRRARARAARGGSAHVASVRVRPRRISAIHALLCTRAARPLTFPPRRLSVADRLPLRGQLPRHLLHRFPRQRDGRHQALLHR